MPELKILCFATLGSGSNEEDRIRTLHGRLEPAVFPYTRQSRWRNVAALFRELQRTRPDLAVMEGSGIPGGVALLLARWFLGVRYVVSSGDAVAPFLAMRVPWLAPLFSLYERLLYRNAAGFIGWTPYLAGRALTYGAPRAMTAAGFAPFPPAPERREAVRAQLGIPADAIVFGLAGSLVWEATRGYCYGLELVEAARRLDRPDLRILILGDGSGKERLEQLAGDQLGRTILLPGRIAPGELPGYLAAMDLGSLPQSTDAVGAFRYTTKISEYLSAGLPIVTGETPFAYDFDDGWLVRLPGPGPWDPAYIGALRDMMNRVTRDEILALKARLPAGTPAVFDRDRQIRIVTAFITEIAASQRGGPRGSL